MLGYRQRMKIIDTDDHLSSVPDTNFSNPVVCCSKTGGVVGLLMYHATQSGIREGHFIRVAAVYASNLTKLHP